MLLCAEVSVIYARFEERCSHHADDECSRVEEKIKCRIQAERPATYLVPHRFVRPFTVLFFRHHSPTFTCCSAVKEAELKAEKKFQERLEKLLSSSGMMLPASATAVAAAAPVVVEEGTPFQKRNAHILSAAEAGKSRWGSMEIERALGQAKPAASATAASVSAPPAASTSFDRRNARVVASAGVGKSRWGTMEVERAAKMNGSASPPPPAAAVVEEAGCISLDDRLNLGARLLGTAAPPAPASTLTAFDMRNARVVASAGVGKSRWGTMEVERAAKMNGSASPPPPAAAVVEEAGCISLDDRLNLGARLLGTAAPPAPASTLTAFDMRNARVVASAGVGKSRWGTMEVERAMRNGSAASAAAIVFAAPPAVAAEEKRAASLEDRVNLGARLLGA